ncbi:metallothiol transferase [Alkalihalobacillus xiaoxiensis]|uniref:Metallothiol transferase n=1 Tax=Shouchella xiaoxiensis TaxID=766895 RepID=A0ABS2SP62_9BACI|nr:metallothiol transferase FosB [Shouchella xiaoxiensis]MBM7837319.1 metallothiol transferase [Shouchella xiaoxiensis]
MKLNHITFSVSNLEKSIAFYQEIFNASLLVKGEKMAYFDLDGLWLALNVETDIERSEVNESYTHIAFTITEEELSAMTEKLNKLGVNILDGRARSKEDKRSIYFTDLDGHRFEFHTGTLQERLTYYQNEKKHLDFYS